MQNPNPAQAGTLPTRIRGCIFCNTTDAEVVYAAKLPDTPGPSDVLHYQYKNTADFNNVWHYRMVRCRGCGHLYANPIFASNVVESSYLEQDHDNQFGLDDQLLLRTHRGYAALVCPHLPAPEFRRLQVDLGCDTGLFLRATRDFNFQRVVGIEPGVGSADRARQLPWVEVQQKIFAPTDFTAGTVDFLSMIHVLDHLVDPRQLIREIRPRLTQAGLVLAVVHNSQSLIARISGANWPVISLVHFDYFTPATLRRIFEVEGYRVIAIHRTKNYFPLSHLIRFSPFLPVGLRARLLQLVHRRPLNNLVWGLRLGNIAVLAAAR